MVKECQPVEIDINTIGDKIDKCIDDFLQINGIKKDYKSITSVKHSTINYMMSYIYSQLFKPKQRMINNQKSIINYNDVELLQVLADKYINILQRFNKSLGLMSFSYMIGCDYSTLRLWLQNDEKANPARFRILKGLQESHKVQQIALLNDSPVGAMATANNDIETGLRWAQNQQPQIVHNTAFVIPSERVDRLKIAAGADPANAQQ